MYKVEITSRESTINKTFQTTIEIIPNNQQTKDELTQIFQKDNYYLITYLNPLMWLFNAAPMYVYIKPYQPSMASSNQLLKINKEIVFTFKKKAHRKHFERVVHDILSKFIDKKLDELEISSRKRNFFRMIKPI